MGTMSAQLLLKKLRRIPNKIKQERRVKSQLKRSILVACISGAIGLPMAWAGNEIPLSLEESVATGIRGSSSVLKSQNDVRFNGAQLLQSYGNFLPNLVANG